MFAPIEYVDGTGNVFSRTGVPVSGSPPNHLVNVARFLALTNIFAEFILTLDNN